MQKPYVRGANRVFVSRELGSVSVTRHACASVLVCVFLWVKSQDSTTSEPEQVQSTPRPPRFGAKVKHVLFLSFFGSNGARAEQTRLSGSRRHNYVTKNCRPQTPSTGLRHPSWRKVPGNDARVLAILGHLFLCLQF